MQNTKPDLNQIDFLFSKISEGFAYCKIITDEKGKPIDWVYLDVNDAYERINGVKKADVIGKKATEVLPNIQRDPADWINLYGKVALTGEPVVTERYAEVRKKWYHISAYSPQKGYFVSIFEDITERKKSEDELRISEDRFRSVLENSLDVVYRFNLQTGRYEYMSPASKLLLGFEPEELMSMSNEDVFSHVHPDDLPILRKDLIRINEVGKGVSEYRFMGKDGKYSWWSNQMVISKDKDGKPLYRDGFVRNVTERKKAEDEVRKAKDDWERTFDAVPDLIAILDTNYRIVRANRAMAQQLGITPEEAVGLICYECVHGTNAPPDNCPHAHLLKDGKQHTAEVNESRLGGDFVVSASPLKDQNGKLIGCTHVARNVTERKKSEDALKKSEEKYRSLFTNMIDGFAHCQMIFNTEGKPIDFVYLEVNDAFEKLTGLKKEMVLGKKVSEAIPGTLQNNPELIETYGRVASTGKSERFEIYFKPLRIWFSIAAYSEKKGYFVAILQNVTKRKHTEEALRESEQRWSTTLTSIGDAVIATDTVGKITFMNPVAEELTGWTQKEAKQKPIQQVFNIINEHTKKEVDSPVTKVLREGLIVGLANHTVLIRKDGTEVPIDDSGAPIVTEEGTIRGVVLVFRDISERKKNEDAIQRQASLIDLNPDAIIVRTFDGTINFWSKGAEKLYGWTKKEAIGKNTHVLFQTKFPEPFDSIMRKLKTEKKWSGELVHRTKGGKEVTVQSWWQAEETEHGKIKSILESNVDLTERKKSEVEIAQAKQRLDAHMDNSPEAVIEFDPEFRVIRWSEQATRVFGWSKEEILGKSIAEMPWVYAGDIGIVQQVSSDLLTGKRSRVVSSNRNLRKDGSIIDCEWYNSAIYDADGKLVSILAQVLDVTERKRAEKEIARLASFPTLNPNPVIEVNPEGKITYVNPATKKLFPSLKTEGLKHIFFSDWENVKAVFEDTSIDTFGREVKINEHWYHQQFYLVPKTNQIRIYTTDIDELKQTEQARAKAQTKLEENAVMLEEYASQMEELAEQRAQQLQNSERLAAIGQTAGMVGHDIRNPLQAITSDMYIISEEAKTLKDGESKQAIIESIDSINQNLTYINKIVSDLQDYTRPLKPNLQDANLSELIEGTLLTINVPKGVEVTTCVTNGAKPIRTDVAYMRRILTNLMTNAVQAMQEEGKLTIQATKKKDAIVVTVEDTGVGIPDEVKAKMFTPLFTTKSKGQGLGLAVVKRLVEALKGTIVFDSVAGKGTKFVVELPQKR